MICNRDFNSSCNYLAHCGRTEEEINLKMKKRFQGTSSSIKPAKKYFLISDIMPQKRRLSKMVSYTDGK